MKTKRTDQQKLPVKSGYSILVVGLGRGILLVGFGIRALPTLLAP
jgi:hypothetical protein